MIKPNKILFTKSVLSSNLPNLHLVWITIGTNLELIGPCLFNQLV